MTPREALETALDPSHAQAVIEHRQRLRKPMTAYAAELLARRLAECPNPNEAADMMIEKGWQSISSAWIKPKEQPKVPTFQASHRITKREPDVSPEERKRVGGKMIAFGNALNTVLQNAREAQEQARRERVIQKANEIIARDPRPLASRLGYDVGDETRGTVGSDD